MWYCSVCVHNVWNEAYPTMLSTMVHCVAMSLCLHCVHHCIIMNSWLCSHCVCHCAFNAYIVVVTLCMYVIIYTVDCFLDYYNYLLIIVISLTLTFDCNKNSCASHLFVLSDCMKIVVIRIVSQIPFSLTRVLHVYIRHCANTVYAIVLTLCMSLCSHLCWIH